MNFNLWNRIFAGIVFLVSTIVLLMTVAPTTSFWDCGEFITATVTMGVPHPPGAPFFQIVGRMFSLLPVADDPGFRVNLLSVFSSSLSVLFTYLVAIRFLRQWKGDPTTAISASTMMLSAAIGALILSWSDTFWFNAVEAEVYGIGIFFITIVVWIATEWYFKIGVFDSERSLLLIAYLLGLSIGVHLLSLLAVFYVFVLIFLRDRETRDINLLSVSLAALISVVGFSLIYPGIIKYIPDLLGSNYGPYLLIILIAAMIYFVTAKQFHAQLRMLVLAVLLVALGYSTYALVPIRAGQKPALNENAPATLEGLYSYLNREQYGTYPLMSGPNYSNALGRIETEKKTFLPRRWNHESVNSYRKYDSDIHYFFSYQFGHIFLRYFLWNFVGRAGDIQDAPVTLFDVDGDWSESAGYPNKYYGIPFLLGLIGLLYHFKRDRRTATAMTVLFFIMGIGLVLYFNMSEPQVRERDYFFIGSFQVFALWAGLGVFAIAEYVRNAAKGNEAVALAVAVLLVVAAPVNMLSTNYQTHDRSLNFVAFDYAYNLLQSCEEDAILFTGGDNDTFPVWYLQYTAGVRRDVRVINLSLLNTSWYSKQLKNEEPYGAKTVKISYSDQELDNLLPVQWDERSMSIPVDPKKFDFDSYSDFMSLEENEEKPTSFNFVVKPTYTDPRGSQGLRNQDILILDILNNNINDRPIYFATSVGSSDQAGLEEYLIVEGLARRVVPFKLSYRADRYYSAMNTDLVKRQLTETRTEPVNTRAIGFLFRELNNPRINLDEASTKMMYSFRVLYMALGQVLIQDRQDFEGTKKLLATMDKVIPEKYHIFEPNLRTDLANMYLMMDDTTGYLQHAAPLEEYYLNILKDNPTGQGLPRSPHRFLLELYQLTGNYERAIDFLLRMQKEIGNDPNLEQYLRLFQQLQKERQSGVKDTAQLMQQ